AGLVFDRETARSVCESFADNLATLHSIDYAAIGLSDFGRPAGYMERQISGWIERYHGSKTQEHAETDRLFDWMQQKLPLATQPALIHNDYKFDNVVLSSNDLAQIVGVLDWEMSTIGEPLSDLGTALAYWVEPGDVDELQQIRWGPTNCPGS